jgi:acyl transferase domain-containing protein
VNAHDVLEEYVPAVSTQDAANEPAPDAACRASIVLSARNSSQLEARVRQLLEHLDVTNYTDGDLPSIAYTLQVGRDAMEQRLAFTAGGIDEMRRKLAACLDGGLGRAGIEGCHVGAAKRDKTIPTTSANGEDNLRAWVDGATVEWEKSYVRRPRRLSLPSYPFARERHWIGASTATLHPLVQRDASTADAQRFSSTFTGEEFYLADHVVKGSKVLPGVCYLEMIRAAVVLSGRSPDAGNSQVTLKNLVWMKPLEVNDARQVHIDLTPQASGELAFEIHSAAQAAESGGTEVVHAQGRALFATAAEVAPVDLVALQARCERAVEPEHCYATFRRVGMVHGPGYSGLRSAQVGTDADQRRFGGAHKQFHGM